MPESRQDCDAARRTFWLRQNAKDSEPALKILFQHQLNFLRPSVFNIEEGEFPSGGLWGVCVETAANITSERMNDNQKEFESQESGVGSRESENMPLTLDS